MKTRLRKTLQVLNILGFLATVAVNALANTLPIAGRTTGELSDFYPNLFTPAGITFSIWGLIYVLLGIFTVYQATGLFRAVASSGPDAPASDFRDRISWFFLLSSAANMGWIFAWHHRMIMLSFALMLILLGSLLALYVRLEVRYGGAVKQTILEKVFIHLPISVYLGWITVATIANASALLVNAGWNGFGLSESFWTVLVIGAGLVIGLVTLFSRRDPAYALVIVWAYAGIVVKRLTEDPKPNLPIVLTASIGGAVLLFDTAFVGIRLLIKAVKREQPS